MTELHHYYENYDEETRLRQDNLHRIEYLTTIHLLKKYVPEHSKILDCCAGTGIYAFELARLGHTVSAGDIVEKHVQMMRKNPEAHILKEIYCGDTLQMARFADHAFDAVLCLGALYHLHAPEERHLAVKECLRVLKPGGIFAFSYMTRQAVYLAQLMTAVKPVDIDLRIEEYTKLDAALSTGKYGIFYGMTSDELNEMVARCELTTTAQAAAYPFFYSIYNQINEMSPEEFAEYMKCHLATCEHPVVARNTMNGLCVCRK